MTKIVQELKQAYIQFTDEEMIELNMHPNQKFTVEVNDDQSFSLIPFSKVDVDLSEFPRSILEFIIQESAEKDISVNEIISDALEKFLENHER
jgi:hypothetical protein